MVFQNSWHILRSNILICCPTSQNSMFYIGLYNFFFMNTNWYDIVLCLGASYKKSFRGLADYVWCQVSPIISLFCKYPITKILNFNLSRLPSDWIFPYSYQCMVSLDIPSIYCPLERSDCWLSCFRPSLFGVCRQSGDFWKFLDSGMNCDTSETDSPKIGYYLLY